MKKTMIRILSCVLVVAALVVPITSIASAVDYFPAVNYKGVSIVDALASIGVNPTKNYRRQIFEENFPGETYTYSAKQNLAMLDLLTSGLLVNPGPEVPAASSNAPAAPAAPAAKPGCYPAPKYRGVSIVDALASIKVDPSYAHRAVIYYANDLMDVYGPFKGRAEQNIAMLNLLLDGALKMA